MIGKVLQLTRKKGETVWLQCDVSEHLRSSIEWRWNGRNVQDTLFNNFLLTKEQSKDLLSLSRLLILILNHLDLIIINMNTSLSGQYTCFIDHQPIVSYSLETDRGTIFSIVAFCFILLSIRFICVWRCYFNHKFIST